MRSHAPTLETSPHVAPARSSVSRDKPAARIGWLDSIRGIAALLVLIIHFYHNALVALLNAQGFSLIPQQHRMLEDTLTFLQLHDVHQFDTLSDWILGYLDLGKLGVILFFMLSGFVIPFSLRPTSAAPIKQFVVSRLCRLYPVYWLSLLLILVFQPWPITMGGLKIALNFTMFQKFLMVPDLNGVAWTLQIELAFYILCILQFATGILSRFGPNVWTIALLGAGALGLAIVRGQGLWDSAPVALPMGLMVMFLGYAWRRTLLREEFIRPKYLLLVAGATVALIIQCCYLAYGESGQTYATSYTLAVILFMLFSTLLKMEHPWLKYLGAISYSTYLLHPLVGKLILPSLVAIAPTLFTHVPFLLVLPIAGAIAITYVISAITYHVIEQPVNDWGRAWMKRHFRRAASPA